MKVLPILQEDGQGLFSILFAVNETVSLNMKIFEIEQTQGEG